MFLPNGLGVKSQNRATIALFSILIELMSLPLNLKSLSFKIL